MTLMHASPTESCWRRTDASTVSATDSIELRVTNAAPYGFGSEGGASVLSAVSRTGSATHAMPSDMLGILMNGVDVYGHHRRFAIVVHNETSVLEQPEIVRGRARHGWEHIQGRLKDFAKLPHDWDGEGSNAPPPTVISNAQFFVAAAMVNDVPVPELYIDGGGEVGFRWRKFDWFASVSFLDDGHGVAYLETLHTSEPVRVDAVWPWQEAPNRKRVFDGLKAFA